MGGKGLNGVLQGLQKTVISIFARQFITKPFENLVSGFAENAFKGSGGGGGGFISSALSSLFGGGSGILGFANGGTPPVGKVSLVGERGPELFVPNTAGRIIPNNMLGMGSSNSSNVYNINVRVPEGTSRSTGSQIAADLQRKLAYGSRNN